MNECPRKEVTFCCITDPEQLSSSPRDMETSSGRDFVTFQEFLFFLSLSFFLNDNWYFSLWKAGTPWPRQHNQCSSWLRGRGREGEGIRGLSYLISVSTRASVWCKKSRCFPPPFTTLLHFFSFSPTEVCQSLVSPRHPVHSVPFLLCSENVNISFSLKLNQNFGCAGMDHMSVATQRQRFF